MEKGYKFYNGCSYVVHPIKLVKDLSLQSKERKLWKFSLGTMNKKMLESMNL